MPETAERTIAGRPLALPALDIHTVGAGGGSIAWRDAGGALRVGPASAGADPGPACYGRGGARADGHRRQPAARAAARGRAARRRAARSTAARPSARSRALARELGPRAARVRARGSCASPRREMLGALRVMTVERGIDPRGFALMPFGGAGPLHAARARARARHRARALPARLRRAVRARPRRRGAAARRRAHRHARAPARCRRSACRASARRSSPRPARGSPAAPARVRVRHELRYRGQSFELPVDERREIRRRRRRSVEPRGSIRTRCARRSRRRTSCATATATSAPRSSWSTCARQCGARRPQLRPRDRREARAGDRARARSCSTAEPVEASVLRGELAPGTRVSRARRCARCREATLLVPPRLVGRGRRARDRSPARAPRSERAGPDRAAGRLTARCARRAKRWAWC